MKSDGYVLDEDRLRQISRSIRDYVPTSATAASPVEHQTKQFESLLNDAFHTSSCTTLTAAHRVAAWNTLCSLIDRSLDSDILAVKNACWSLGIWNRSLGLFLNHAQSARPKSSRQLLNTLTNALRKGLANGNLDVVVLSGYAVKDLLSALQDYEDPSRAKASAQLLGNLLQKDVIPISSVLGYVPCPSSEERASIQALLLTIFRWLGKADFGSTIATTVSTVLDKIEDLEGSKIQLSKTGSSDLIWLEPLQDAYHEDAVHVDDLRAHLFPVLFKRKFEDFVAFLKYQGLTGFPPLIDALATTGSMKASGSDELLYAALQTGKDLSLLFETDNEQMACTPSMVFLPISYIEDLLFRSLRDARLAGLSLLTTSPLATRPLSQRALQLIRKALSVFFADVDADFRSEVFGTLQRLTDRIRSITKILSQQVKREPGAVEPLQAFRHHQEFLRWLQRFLIRELRPTASYQRHISALKGISILARSGLDRAVPTGFWTKSARGETKWAFHLDILTSDLQRQLLDLLLDPFDDVRQAAASILHFYCFKVDAGLTVDTFRKARERSERRMYLSGRADQADGVAHLFALMHKSATADGPRPEAGLDPLEELIQKLRDLLAIAAQDLATAVERYPLHGLLTGLRYILSGDSKLDGDTSQALYDNLVQLWEVVKPILCDDAPEGYLPEELEETSNSTKETLSYCWRALKESSLLLSCLLARQQSDSKQIEAISELCFTQLSELRHRGAFSTVSQTWTACCTKCQGLRRSDDTSMNQHFYDKVVRTLHNRIAINTRRSAGLPSLICGILIADKSGELIARAFNDLEAVSRQEVDAASAEEGSLPQVHAMNCMKDILKNASLGEHSERYVPVALQLAADALQSNVWAIRNCGLMLFRAVIDRLLGTSAAHLEDDAQALKRISIEQHPQLLDIILRLLAMPAQDIVSRYEGVFPALQLLQLTRIPKNRVMEVKKAVEALTSVPSWHVRDKAARTLSTFENPPSIARCMEHLLDGAMPSENAVHGMLLSARHTLSRTQNSLKQVPKPAETFEIDTIQEALDTIGFSTAKVMQSSKSFVSKSAALDVLRECSALGPFIAARHDHRRLLAYISAAQVTGDLGMVTVFEQLLQDHIETPGAAVVRQAWARLLAQYLIVDQPVESEEMYGYHYLVQKLSRLDEDATSCFLQVLQGQFDPSGPIAEFIVDACSDIVNSQYGVELICQAQKTLLMLCKRSECNTDLAVALSSQDALVENVCNQKYVDQWLQLFAFQLDHRSDTDISDLDQIEEQLLQDILQWSAECAAAITATGIHNREAAADALDCVRRLWSILSNTSNVQLDSAFLNLCIALYDLLNDDDEDIRLQASRILSRILSACNSLGSAQTVELEPITSSQKLLGFCIRRWKSNNELIKTALYRATGSLADPVATQLEAAAHSDTALFAEEKQNLYIDEAREARTWSQAVQRLEANAISKQITTQLGAWVADGLDTLTGHSKSHPDGALGWSTNSDVFVLGLRVIYGAEILFHLAARGVRVPVQPSELRKKIFVCLTAFENGQVNCLWRWEVERVLKDSVASKVRILGNAVEETADRAGAVSHRV